MWWLRRFPQEGEALADREAFRARAVSAAVAAAFAGTRCCCPQSFLQPSFLQALAPPPLAAQTLHPSHPRRAATTAPPAPKPRSQSWLDTFALATPSRLRASTAAPPLTAPLSRWVGAARSPPRPTRERAWCGRLFLPLLDSSSAAAQPAPLSPPPASCTPPPHPEPPLNNLSNTPPLHPYTHKPRPPMQKHTTCVTEHEKYALAATKPGGYAAQGRSDGAPAAAAGGSGEGEVAGLEFLSERAPWRCIVCNVGCTSRETLLGHAAGSKHKRRVSLLGFVWVFKGWGWGCWLGRASDGWTAGGCVVAVWLGW